MSRLQKPVIPAPGYDLDDMRAAISLLDRLRPGETAAQVLSINPRTLERIESGQKACPPDLRREIAGHVRSLAHRLDPL